MRSRISRHLDAAALVRGPVLVGARAGGLGTEAPAPSAGAEPVLPPEFSWIDYTVLLLHVAAEIEHSLMVQYLFAAYSLGGPQVPDAQRKQVRRSQEIILGIAKEEMGHLVTVQNLLTVLGAPLNFDRVPPSGHHRDSKRPPGPIVKRDDAVIVRLDRRCCSPSPPEG